MIYYQPDRSPTQYNTGRKLIDYAKKLVPIFGVSVSIMHLAHALLEIRNSILVTRR
jgi:hypothetical protein